MSVIHTTVSAVTTPCRIGANIRSIFFVAHSIYNVVGVVRIGRADKRFAFNVVVFAFYAYVYVRAPCGSCVAVGNTS